MRTIDEFIQGLSAIAEPEFTSQRVHEYLRANPVDPATLAPYLHYEKTHYTRNLIHRTPLYELLAICWESGQLSRIHNHAGQQCWMAVPVGRLAVQNYDVVAIDPKTGHCRLRAASRLLMDPAHPAHVEQERPVHAVLNLPEYGQRAVSLHVYSKPYDRCLVYQLETSTYMEVPLFFDSEYGKPVPAAR
jgi:cysteine dioxygenase